MSNSERFRVDKDPKVIEFNVLLRSSTLLQVSSDHGCVIDASSLSQEDQKKEEGRCEGHAVSSTPSSSSASSSSVTAITVSDDEFFEVVKMQEAAARTRTRTATLELGGGLDMDENDNGFRTPVSLDHRIPVIQECPPAPRKPKFSSKRKASFSSSSSTRCKLFMLDLSDQEIGSLFPPALLADPRGKIKKVRGGAGDTK